MSDIHGPKEATLVDVAEQTDITTEGMALIGDLLTASMRQTQHTIDSLLDYERERVKELAQALVKVDAILAGATVIDRKTEYALRRMEPKFWMAADILDRMQSDQ